MFSRLAFYGGYTRLRSQVPLYPLADIKAIAKAIGAQMPWDRDHSDWAVLSTDIVVERVDRRQRITDAYWIKPQSEIDGSSAKSIQNNFLIEEAVWRSRGGQLHRIVSEALHPIETLNVGRLYDELNARPSRVSHQEKQIFADAFVKFWNPDSTLGQILARVEGKLKISPEAGWSTFSAAIQAKALSLDLKELLSEDGPVFMSQEQT